MRAARACVRACVGLAGRGGKRGIGRRGGIGIFFFFFFFWHATCFSFSLSLPSPAIGADAPTDARSLAGEHGQCQSLRDFRLHGKGVAFLSRERKGESINGLCPIKLANPGDFFSGRCPQRARHPCEGCPVALGTLSFYSERGQRPWPFLLALPQRQWPEHQVGPLFG